MGEMAKIARGGDKQSVAESKIERGGKQKPQGDLGKVPHTGNPKIPLNPNADHDPQGVGTH